MVKINENNECQCPVCKMIREFFVCEAGKEYEAIGNLVDALQQYADVLQKADKLFEDASKNIKKRGLHRDNINKDKDLDSRIIENRIRFIYEGLVNKVEQTNQEHDDEEDKKHEKIL